MNGQTQDTTATLAMVFGMSLLANNIRAQATGTVDIRAARELAVIARVLENRLGAARKSFEAGAASPERAVPCPAA